MTTLAQLAERMRLWRARPQVFVREVFGVTPDAWQDEVLEIFPTHPRIAMKACKGPGKTAVLAMLAWNFLLTRPRPKVAAVSISAENLADGLWTEMAKWQAKSPLLRELFTWTKTRIFCNEVPEEWWMSARTWPKSGSADDQANTLAGLHADYMLFILDEAGGIPSGVMAAAEAGLANAMGLAGHEAHIVMAGNPTHLAGPLYDACTRERSLWHVVEISSAPDDPKRTPRVSIEWARQQIQKYGAENPWVLVNVFGRFPPSSLNSLLGPDEVKEAMERHHREDQYAGASRILGVDVAREGDDRSVIFPRQGIVAWEPIVMRNANSIQGAGAVARKWQDWEADGCFVDNTGGFGGGWLDQLVQLGRDPVGIHFSGKATDERYFNKRAEMHFELADWVKNGGALPKIPELVEELTAPTYWFKGDKLILEDKDQIKARIGRSPDYADALALTFALPVLPMRRSSREGGALGAQRKRHDPFARDRLRR
jgi:phage terminase large subunit